MVVLPGCLRLNARRLRNQDVFDGDPLPGRDNREIASRVRESHGLVIRCPQDGGLGGGDVDGRDGDGTRLITPGHHVQRCAIDKQGCLGWLVNAATRIGENPCGAHASGPVRRENVRVGGRTLIPLSGDGAATDTAEGGCVRHELRQSENKDDDREGCTGNDLLIQQPLVQGFVSEALRIARTARRTKAFPGCARGGRGLVRRRRRAGCRRGSLRARDERTQDWLQRRGDARVARRSACRLLGGALRLRLASGHGGGIRLRGSPAGKVVAHTTFLPHAPREPPPIPCPGLVPRM